MKVVENCLHGNGASFFHITFRTYWWGAFVVLHAILSRSTGNCNIFYLFIYLFAIIFSSFSLNHLNNSSLFPCWYIQNTVYKSVCVQQILSIESLYHLVSYCSTSHCSAKGVSDGPLRCFPSSCGVTCAVLNCSWR